MLQLQMFAIFDKKAVSYMEPFCMHQKGQAIRACEDLVKNPQTMMSKHPADFALFHIGQFDDASGIITPLSAPQHIEEFVNMVSQK